MNRIIKKTICLMFCVIFLCILFGCNNGTESFEGYYVDVNHIINPNTGMPYSIKYNNKTKKYENTTDHIISATIIGPSAMDSDCYATAICVMGVEKSREFINNFIDEGKIDAVIIFTQDNKMLVYGEVTGYNADNEFEDYKQYEMVYGTLDSKVNIEEFTIPAGKYKRYHEFAFTDGMDFEITIFGNDDNKKDALKNEMLAKVDELDKEINLTHENSDLVRLNKSLPGQRIEIGNYCYYLLSESLRINGETDGAFNIAVTPLSRLWNVDIDGIGSYKAVGSQKYWTYPNSLPDIKSVESLQKKTDLSGLELHAEDGKYYATRNNADLELDLGGIAKGYALDLCADILRNNNVESAQIIISGHIYEIGNNFKTDTKKNSTWKIGITHPAQKHKVIKKSICAIEIFGNTSITTSGDYERFYSFKYEGTEENEDGEEYMSPNVNGTFHLTL